MFKSINKNVVQFSLTLPLVLSGLVSPGTAHADTQTRTTTWAYTAQGLPSQQTQEPSKPDNCLQTSYQYDLFGNRTSTSAAACAGATGSTVASAATARTATNSFGSDGYFPVSSANALAQTETKAYDYRFGAMTSLTGPNGLSTNWSYDNFGRKILEVRADGTSTGWQYKLCTDAGANCPGAIGGATVQRLVIEQTYKAGAGGTTSTTASAPEKRQYYDTLNRVVRVQTQGFDGTGAAPTLVQDTWYNALGQMAQQSNAYVLNTGTPVWTSYTYDAIGRVSTESHPDAAAAGGIATSSYLYNGLSATVTNAKGQTKTTTKNAQGQVAVVADTQGNTVAYSYDAAGNLIATNAAGSITTMGYDLRGRKTAMLDPAMGSWTYAYNAFGELVSQTDSLNQTTTLTYDVLGRMVQRIEPDLNSQWSFDANFDASSCGKGIGKLCEAKTDNGYNRKQTYDAVGRLNSTATVLDNAGSPATVTEAFDPLTGKVATKTWPTGYQASYSYSALGYLTGITGGGTNGFTQTTSYQVLAMDAAGHVTQYKLGGKVTTVKTFDANTQRLTSQTATTDGQTSGNVLNQSYSYDALGNLLTRNDTSPGVGTQESFSYDSLNRLSMATILGGAVSPPTTVQVLYDVRGNIAYKSDVGRYWYDAARPNRMTQVTLETAPGATIPLTGTRALSYAFDDYATGAQTVNGVTVGNGNLAYTVTQDTVNNRHFVRYESYTSFNMPQSMTYSNFAANTTTCLPGYTLSNGMCTLSANTAVAATPVYTCSTGQTLSGSTCVVAATSNYSCPTGYTLSGTTCSKTTSSAGTPQVMCPSGYSMINYQGYLFCANADWSSTTSTINGYSCPAGTTLSGSNCLTTTTVAATFVNYSCNAGLTLSGSSCVRVATIASYTCPAGQLSGNNCVVTNAISVAPGSNNASDRTLTYIYGPEHQRIRENVALSGNGTSAYFAGDTWYLNGEDSLGLTYEKEVRANGTTEHKHYLTADGQVFALFTSRAGTLNGLPATTTSYFQHDHLSSIAAITDETGVVTERLAYDPWGKRRNITTLAGTPDTLDALVGIKTDRGYTEHEHLDEVGVIHMNGRVFDPLIGRFMSADTIIPNPYDLRAFNRYAYVYNNPLKMFDPTGHEPDGGDSDGGSSSGWGIFSGLVSFLHNLFGGGTVSSQPSGDPDGPGTFTNEYGVTYTITPVALPTFYLATPLGPPIPGPVIGGGVGSPSIGGYPRDESGPKLDLGSGPVGTTFRLAIAASEASFLHALSVNGGDDTKKADNVPANIGPGPNAGESVPAGPSPRPTKEQQDKINGIGNTDGCHSCGNTDPGTKSGNWVGDHQPPTALNPEGKPQSYYPQCLACSQVQGGRIRGLISGWSPKRD